MTKRRAGGALTVPLRTRRLWTPRHRRFATGWVREDYLTAADEIDRVSHSDAFVHLLSCFLHFFSGGGAAGASACS